MSSTFSNDNQINKRSRIETSSRDRFKFSFLILFRTQLGPDSMPKGSWKGLAVLWAWQLQEISRTHSRINQIGSAEKLSRRQNIWLHLLYLSVYLLFDPLPSHHMAKVELFWIVSSFVELCWVVLSGVVLSCVELCWVVLRRVVLCCVELYWFLSLASPGGRDVGAQGCLCNQFFSLCASRVWANCDLCSIGGIFCFL